MKMETHPLHNGNGSKAAARFTVAVAVTLSASTVLAAVAWAFHITQRVAAVEKDSQANTVRIQALESGRTTPMAAETRAEFNAIWRELERIGGRRTKEP